MERTLSWIRHDMNHKEDDTKKTTAKSTSGKGRPLPKSQTKSRRRSDSLPRKQSRKPSQPQIEENSQATPQGVQTAQPQATAQAPAGGVVSSTNADASNKGYYTEQPMATQQNYQPMAYGASHPQNMGPGGYQGDASMLYNSAASNVAPMADSSVPENPLIAFASQATQPMPPNADSVYMWNGSGNGWHDWTAAIADTNDRYSANALLTLGGGAMRHQSDQSMDSSFIMNHGNSLAQQGGDIPQAPQAGQTWPIMMFDNNNSSATSG